MQRFKAEAGVIKVEEIFPFLSIEYTIVQWQILEVPMLGLKYPEPVLELLSDTAFTISVAIFSLGQVSFIDDSKFGLGSESDELFRGAVFLLLVLVLSVLLLIMNKVHNDENMAAISQ